MDCVRSHGIQYAPALAVVDGLPEPYRRWNVPPGVIVYWRTWHVAVEILWETLRFHEDSLAPFGIASHIRVPDRLPVIVDGNGLRDQRHDVIAAPPEIFLQLRRIRRPNAVETRCALVTAVSRRRRITPHESEVTLARQNRATESAARVEKEVTVPIPRQRQFQLEFVLG